MTSEDISLTQPMFEPATPRSRDGWTRRRRRLRERYGPWAVVTGASSGIGRALAAELAASGFDLVLVSRRVAELEGVAVSLAERHGATSRVQPLDLAASTGLAELVAATSDLDVGLLVAAAGFGTSGDFVDADLDDELRMLDVNCRAVLAQTWAFGRRFAARGRGGIVLLSSIVGFQGAPHAAHYAATKAYIQTLAEALHVELAGRGVDVVAAAPGPVHSGFAAAADMRMGGALRPDDVAGPILRALGRRPTALPGVRSRVLKDSLAPLPRRVRVRIMGRVIGGMTRHQRDGDERRER